MNSRLAIIGSLLLLAVLQGCAGPQPLHDASFAPTMPATPVPSQDNNGAIYQPVNGMALFEDNKAHRVGDILTITLVEKTAASKAASTSATKDQTVDMSADSILGSTPSFRGKNPLEASISGKRDFSGDGASTQSNALTGNITVTIAQVLPNGNLLVRGEKVLTLNQGDEFIRVSGYVRPADIAPDNTVLSTKIASAEISYGGRGALADANEMGWLARFFNSGIWPF